MVSNRLDVTMGMRWIVVLGLGLAACSSSPAAPSTRLVAITHLLAYDPGDAVVIRFVNIGDQGLFFNACFAALERQQGNSWEPLGPATGTVSCQSIAHLLAPGATDSIRFVLPANLGSAVYRYVFDTFETTDNVPVRPADRESNPFRVR